MKSWDALKEFFRPRDVTIALPDDPFVVIDRDRAIDRLNLAEKAKDNGVANLPPSDASGFDEVESDIVTEIGEYAARAQVDAANSHKVYGQRLSELSLLGRLQAIKGATQQVIGDYRTTIINAQGRLSLAKDAIKESYRELEQFKREHGLTRPAHNGIHPAYAWSAIGFSWLLESLLNTVLLRVNDAYGLVGGFVAAAIVAAFNVVVSAFVGMRVWPHLFHKETIHKVMSFLGVAIWLLVITLWNLVAGHYRDAKAAGLPDPEIAALGLFVDHPFTFDSLYSYGLLGIGFLAAIIAGLAGFEKDDPYAGYGAIYRRHEERCEEYADEIEDAFDELKETRGEAIEEAHAIRDELSSQFRERGQIIAAREAHRNRYREYQDYLEDIANNLLEHYRTLNKRARSDDPPPHFKERWLLKRSSMPQDPLEPAIDEDVRSAQRELERSVTEISTAYNEAIESFEHLDQIKGSLADG